MKTLLSVMIIASAMLVSNVGANCPSGCEKKAVCKCEACGCTAKAKKVDCKCDKCACGKPAPAACAVEVEKKTATK